jgi:hypothetical protein
MRAEALPLAYPLIMYTSNAARGLLVSISAAAVIGLVVPIAPIALSVGVFMLGPQIFSLRLHDGRTRGQARINQTDAMLLVAS